MLGQLGRPARRRCSRWRRNGGGGTGVPLSVDGQVLLVHNRTRPRPYRPQGLATDPTGRAPPKGHGPGYDPGGEEGRLRGRSACFPAPRAWHPACSVGAWLVATSGLALALGGAGLTARSRLRPREGRAPGVVTPLRGSCCPGRRRPG